MYGWIADACDASSHVVTASGRLARVLTAAHDELQLSAGKVAWESAAIRSFPDWLGRLAATGLPSRQPTWISAQQSRVLWQNIIRREIRDPLVNVATLTRLAQDAWKKLHDWRVPFDEFLPSAGGQDQRIFARVASAYRDTLRERGWVDDAMAGAYVLRCLGNGELELPERITLAGFDRLTPLVEAILDAARVRGVTVAEAASDISADIVQCSYADADAEMRAAGAWARATLLSEPESSVAIVVSDLARDAERVARLIREGFVPGWQYGNDDSANSIDVSYGRRLSEYPAIQVALLLLSWTQRELYGADVSVLLRTAFLGKSGAGGRARLELSLRKSPDRPWNPGALRRALEGRDESPDAVDWLRRLEEFDGVRRQLLGRAPPSHWAQQFESVLSGFGWPGTSSLDSRDFQLVNRWRDLLNDLSRLAAVSPSISAGEACTELAAIAADTIFQPETENAVFQVLGPLEAAGMLFDRLWVTGLTTEHWPPPGSPLPLVSRSLQRKYGMPDSDPLDTAAYAQRVLSRLAGSARHCVLSHAKYDDDAELSPAAFTESLDVLDGPEDPGWHASDLAVSGLTRTLAQDPVPEIGPGDSIAGGAATIQRQITEPFAAFVYGRLGVSTIQALVTGLSPMLRGNLMHDAAFRLYRDGASTRQLLDWQQDELNARIEQAVDGVLHHYRRNPDPVLHELLELERERLAVLLEELVRIDCQREDFEIDAVEASLDLELAGLSLGLRVDRIDRYEDGSIAILDYKTGARRRFVDAAGEPREVQLIVYASAVDAPIAELGLYNIDSRETGIDGAGRASMGAEAWTEWLDEWRTRIWRAGEELARGDVRIRRWQNAVEARPLNLLSRFGELRRDG
jgi:probable DNA repair protein